MFTLLCRALSSASYQGSVVFCGNAVLTLVPRRSIHLPKWIDSLEKLITALKNHLTPKSNVAYEEYKFGEAKLESGEDIMTYYIYIRWKHLAQTGEFLFGD